MNMSLQFVLGNNKSKKSYVLQEMFIKEAGENPDKEYLYIVPEQFTLQKQKDLVNAHPGKVIMNIDVCSFNRLAHRVFEELGIAEQIILDDIGKSMIIRKIIEENKESLALFKSLVYKEGFVEEVKSVISEFCQYNVSLDQLMAFMENNNLGINFAEKFKEIVKVYSLFKEYLKGRYITSEELLDILAANADRSEILRDCVIVLDEFTGFTPVQYKLITELMKVSQRVMVSLTTDTENTKNYDEPDKQTLFKLSAATIKRLKKIAGSENIKLLSDWVIEENFLEVPQELLHLEKNIFRYPFKIFEGDCNNLELYYGKDMALEAEFVVDKIKELVSNEGMRYRDIAILCGDLKEYGRLLKRAFDREKITYFYDEKKKVLGNPFVEMLLAVFDIVNTDFSYEAVFRYLRCGMSDISREECDLLDNYIYATGIKGARYWNRDFKRKCNKPYIIPLEEVNAIRLKFVDEIMEVAKKLMKLENAADITRALYELVVSRGCEEKLWKLSEGFENEKNMLMAKEYIQVYPAVMGLFDKIMELIPDSLMKVSEYSKIFETGISEVKVGLIPLSVDQIFIGDIERSRIGSAKIVFIMGVNEGLIPKNIINSGIISEVERQILISEGIELAQVRTEAVFTGQYYIYLALTKASERLFITYAGMGSDGKAKRPSYIINKLKSLYIDLRVHDIEPKRRKGEEMIICYKKDKHLSPLLAKEIFRDSSYSVSKVQDYFSCEYAYFLKNGLGIKPRVVPELSAVDMGVIYHDSLHRISLHLSENNLEFYDISGEEMKSLVNNSVDKAANEFLDEHLMEEHINKFLISKTKKLIYGIVQNIAKDSRDSGFSPKDFEVEFKISKNNLVIKGKIDRVDFVTEEGERFYKITDYKSGERKFDPTLFGNGIDIQLVVYSLGAKEIYGDKGKVKGLYYSQLKRPILDYDKKYVQLDDEGNIIYDIESIEGGIKSKMKPTGINLVGEDTKDIEKPEAEAKLSDNQMEKLEEYALGLINEAGEGMQKGSIRVNPYYYKRDNRNSCEWCEYKAICGFDRNNDGFRRLKKYTVNDITKRMEKS